MYGKKQGRLSGSDCCHSGRKGGKAGKKEGGI